MSVGSARRASVGGRFDPRGQERLKEIAELGFGVAAVPKDNAPMRAMEVLTIHAVERGRPGTMPGCRNWAASTAVSPWQALRHSQIVSRIAPNRASTSTRLWPGPGFPGNRCKLTLAGRSIAPKVSYLPPPRTQPAADSAVRHLLS